MKEKLTSKQKIYIVKNLYTWLKENMSYAYMTNKREKSVDFNNIFENYVLQKPQEVFNNQYGICWDQTFLEKYWLDLHDIKCDVIYIELSFLPEQPTHTFLMYEIDGEEYYLENSFEKIKQNTKQSLAKSIEIVVENMLIDYNKEHNTNIIYNKNDDYIITKIKDNPKFGCGVKEFMDFCRKGESIS